MTEEAARPRRTRKWLWITLAGFVLLLAFFLVPPMLGIGRYKIKIAQAVSSSLGRPVRLSSAELRLLPRPGFVITDLTVEEDPSYGAEPVLHANTVTASIRLLSVIGGHLEISRISVDEASFNLVRTREGLWNLDPLFRTAAARSNSGNSARTHSFPYLEATNSRVNIKNGLEKLPFSLVNADLSFWQENPGDWRLRLRGQPARTDVSLDLADTGIVRLEATLKRAPQLRQMPIHLDMEWREAQLGQLSRLVLGADPGWRGDLTGQLQLDGTAESAQVKTRLRASGVHRAEFAPADPLDFDANCNFVYHYSVRSLEKLACDSPLGDGHVMLTGELPQSGNGKWQVSLQRIPVSAGLDMLRTLRSGISDSLEARGTVSGQLTYDPGAAPATPVPPPAHSRAAKAHASNAKVADAPSDALQGSFIVDSFRLNGNGLSQPIQIAKITLEPAASDEGREPHALTASLSVPAGGPSPLTAGLVFAKSGYRLSVRGPASLPRLRELAHLTGFADTSSLDNLAGDPASLDLIAAGPWLPTAKIPVASALPAEESNSGLDHPLNIENADRDQLGGTLTLHNVNWKADTLPGHIQIDNAVLRLGGNSYVWDPVAFTYGPVKGTAGLHVALDCPAATQCPPQVDLRFESLDAAALQAALLGAKPQGSVLSNLIERLSPTTPPVWPRLTANLKANSLALGPVTLQNASITIQVQPDSAEITDANAGLLGGRLSAHGKVSTPQHPSYSFEGTFEKVASTDFCRLLALRCKGGPIDGSGKVSLSGFTDRDLAASADGTLHFDWKRGSIEAGSTEDLPKALSRFDRWTFEAAVSKNGATVGKSQIEPGSRGSEVHPTLTFGDPPQVHFASASTSPDSPKP